MPLAQTSRIPSPPPLTDRKSTRLNSSHLVISYAVFCLKKKKEQQLHFAMFGVENGMPCPGLMHAAHVGDTVADLAGFELFRRFANQLPIAYLIDCIQCL